MNIGQLLRNVIGDMNVSDAKSLELKVGQVVRGVILQLMSETDALVNIGGVQVRARLETPMSQGQVTLLQVQPESTGGQVVLKPLEASGVQIAERSLPDLLKEYELKDSPANRRALQELHHGQAPLSKENVRAFAEAGAAVPDGVDEAQWREAALLAVKRGLPVTSETVGALQRTLFGRPLDQSLKAFAALVSETLAPEWQAAQLPPQVRALVGQIRQSVETLPNLPAAPEAAGEAAAAQAPGGAPASGGAPGRGPAGAQAPAAQLLAAGTAAAPAAEQGAGAAGRGPARAEAGAASAQLQAPAASGGAAAAPAAEPGAGAAGRSPARAEAGVAAKPQAPAAAGGAGAAPAAEQGAAAAGRGPARAEAGAAAAKPQAPAAGGAAAAHAHAQQEPAEWIGRLLKALGVEHEQQLARVQDRGGAGLLPPERLAGGDDALPAASVIPQSADAEQAKTADTLKGLLLQLSAADDAPSALREGAQQLVQQITGQQLLLTPDRTSMFSHMTLMLPLFNGNGSQTASVHIQSRKGQRGELDSANCRLLFDLNMRTLGTTLVDVQVTDRIVSLRIHNDFPVIGELLEEHRDEIRTGLEKIGYHFLSMKVLPYPEPESASPSLSAADSQGGPAPSATRAANLYHTKPYKGVDLRV